MHPQNIEQLAALENLFQMSYPSAAGVNNTPVETITPSVPGNKGTEIFWPVFIIIVVVAGVLYYRYYQVSHRKDQE